MNNIGKRTRRTIPVDSKIQKAQDVVLRTRARYEKAMAELEKLIELRKKLQMKEFMNALEKSDRTFDEVMRFLRT